MLKRILLKVTSSKFWVYVSAFVISVLVMFNVDSTTQDKTGAMILAFGNIVVYVFANIWQKKIESEDGE